MARWNILSARKVDALKRDGVYADGAGLYLRIRGNARYWIYIYHLAGKRREMGLGAQPGVTLAAARARAQGARELLAGGADPLAQRVSEVISVPTFGELADDWVKERASSVRSEKSVARWKRLLGKGGPAAPLRSIPVDQLTAISIAAALNATWSTKPSHTIARNYIEAVLDKAKVLGHREGDNPARWDGNLEHLLSEAPKAEGHHAALPVSDLPAFVAQLRERPAMAARALELTILTAARSGEVFGATWAEIDLDAALWTVPAARMKAGREHRVPLSAPALELLRTVEPLRGTGDWLFPGQRAGRPLSTMAMDMMLRRMGVEATVHGFRSTFRDWAADETDHPREVAEAALAHRVGDATERAYRRGDALEKRRALMADWAAYCGSVPLEAAAEEGRAVHQSSEAAAPGSL